MLYDVYPKYSRIAAYQGRRNSKAVVVSLTRLNVLPSSYHRYGRTHSGME